MYHLVILCLPPPQVATQLPWSFFSPRVLTCHRPPATAPLPSTWPPPTATKQLHGSFWRVAPTPKYWQPRGAHPSRGQLRRAKLRWSSNCWQLPGCYAARGMRRQWLGRGEVVLVAPAAAIWPEVQQEVWRVKRPALPPVARVLGVLLPPLPPPLRSRMKQQLSLQWSCKSAVARQVRLGRDSTQAARVEVVVAAAAATAAPAAPIASVPRKPHAARHLKTNRMNVASVKLRAT